jgi:hypothetical protein
LRRKKKWGTENVMRKGERGPGFIPPNRIKSLGAAAEVKFRRVF